MFLLRGAEKKRNCENITDKGRKNGGKHVSERESTHFVALAVVLQAAGPLAVAAFAVAAVGLALLPFTDFGFEGLWISVQTRLWRHRFHEETFGPEDDGASGRPTLMALRRSVSCSRLLKQLLQLHMLQNSPFAKQSQYLRDDEDFVLEKIKHLIDLF